MGWGPEDLNGLFHSPLYPVLNQLREHYGDGELRRRVEVMLARTGVFRVRETVAEDSETQDEGPVLVQVSVRRLFET